VGPPTAFHAGSGIILIPAQTRIRGVYLGVFGVGEAWLYHRFRCRRDEQECKWYVKTKPHDAIDDKSANSSREEVFVLPMHFWTPAEPVPPLPVCSRSPGIETRLEENIR